MLQAKSGSEHGSWGKGSAKRRFETLTLALKRHYFYAALRSYIKAEFINGKPVVESPAMARHIWVSGRTAHLLRCYARRFDPDARVGVEKALIAFPKHDYEPDVCYWKGARGAAIPENKWRLPVPDFIAEILSKDSLRRDRVQKKRDYEKHGVAEYWIIDPEKKTIERYLLNEKGKYILQPDTEIVSILTLPGLTFNQAALFSDLANDEVCLGLSFPTMQEALEKARAEAEAARILEEKARAEAEVSRISEEKARAEAEAARAEAETARIAEEKALAVAEAARRSEEKAHAESNRQKRNFILYLRKQGISEPQIAELTGLSITEISALEKDA